MKQRAFPHPIVITAAVEGILDEAVAKRTIEHVGAKLGPVHGLHGKGHLRKSLRGYNEAARFAPWLVLMDLNSDAQCAPALRKVLLTAEAPMMKLRIAVREVEAWLLADRERFAGYVGVPLTSIPIDPEALSDPKRSVVEIADHSRRRDIRTDIVPRIGSGRREGPEYVSRMLEFALDNQRGWRPDVAASRAISLRPCIAALRSLVTDAWN
jgi:hypothetical protein